MWFGDFGKLTAVRVFVNLPVTAKSHYSMKTLTPGTSIVPASRLTQDCNTLQERYYRSLTEDCEVKTQSDYWYLSSIASFCVTFIFPPFLLVAVYCVIKAKKGGTK